MTNLLDAQFDSLKDQSISQSASNSMLLHSKDGADDCGGGYVLKKRRTRLTLFSLVGITALFMVAAFVVLIIHLRRTPRELEGTVPEFTQRGIGLMSSVEAELNMTLWPLSPRDAAELRKKTDTAISDLIMYFHDHLDVLEAGDFNGMLRFDTISSIRGSSSQRTPPKWVVSLYMDVLDSVFSRTTTTHFRLAREEDRDVMVCVGYLLNSLAKLMKALNTSELYTAKSSAFSNIAGDIFLLPFGIATPEDVDPYRPSTAVQRVLSDNVTELSYQLSQIRNASARLFPLDMLIQSQSLQFGSFNNVFEDVQFGALIALIVISVSTVALNCVSLTQLLAETDVDVQFAKQLQSHEGILAEISEKVDEIQDLAIEDHSTQKRRRGCLEIEPVLIAAGTVKEVLPYVPTMLQERPINFSLGLQPRQVWYVVFDFCSFCRSYAAAGSRRKNVYYQMATLLSEIEDKTQRLSATVTLSGSRVAVVVGLRSTERAADLVEDIFQIEQSAFNSKLGVVPCGVCFGEALSGNIGSATCKTYTVVGPVVGQARALLNVNTLHNVGVTMTSQVQSFMTRETTLHFRQLERVAPPGNRSDPVCVVEVYKGSAESDLFRDWKSVYELYDKGKFNELVEAVGALEKKYGEGPSISRLRSLANRKVLFSDYCQLSRDALRQDD